MRSKLLALLGSVAVGVTLAVVGTVDAAAEHGHGFNCTPGNPGRAESVHATHQRDDQGNGDDCRTTITTRAPTTTTRAPTTTTKAATPTTKAAVTVAPSAAPRPVTVAPRTTG